jgi:subtilisin family serine protease
MDGKRERPRDPRQRRLELLRERGVGMSEAVPGREFLYRRGELLVARRDADRARELLPEGWRELPLDDRDEPPPADAPYLRIALPEREDVPALVSRLRAAAIAAGANLLLAGEPVYSGGPAVPPHPPPARVTASFAGGAGVGVRIGVLDTGVRGDHPSFTGLTLEPSARSDDPADLDGDGALDSEAGHGTFITGILAELAPGATQVVDRVLDDLGLVSESALCAAILRMAERKVEVLNLSLGGYAQDDLPPPALVATLRWLRRPPLVVAAAGNFGCDRPFWPAALKSVVAVGALDRPGGRPAWFSNFGHWVDACAPGVELTSSFVPFSGPLEADPAGDPRSFGDWAVWSGTSFAAPRFAGALARVKTARGGTVAEAADRLLLSGRTVPGLGVEFDPDA